MQNQNETERINQFLNIASPTIVGQLRLMFQSIGVKVHQRGRGLEMTLVIKSSDKEIRFLVQNLLLEIATVDSKEKPPRFDEKVQDYNFFLDKTLSSARSKVKILFQLLLEIEAAAEAIDQDTKLYDDFCICVPSPKRQSASRSGLLRLPGVNFLSSFVKGIFRPKETA